MRENKLYLYPYRVGSRSVQLLSQALNAMVIRREGSSFILRAHKKVINWGATDCPYLNCLNDRVCIQIASNKLSFFNHIRDFNASNEDSKVRIPSFTISPTEAQGWLSEGDKVLCRGTLTGHSGAGITLLEGNDTPPQAPLYVRYIPKDAEYRVHVFNGEVIDVQRKVRDPSREVSNWQVRSHSNGFMYTRHSPGGGSYSEMCPPDVKDQAKRAVASSGLGFSAVDVIWNAYREAAYVLECNQAPGLQGETVNIYATAIRNFYGQE